MQYLHHLVNKLTGEQDPSIFDNDIWILFAGDNSGGNVKVHLEVTNSITCGSADNAHLYHMFEGADTLKNMWKVLGIIRDQTAAIQSDDFNINGRGVKVFLGADIHFWMIC